MGRRANGELSAKHQAFVDAYVSCWNASEAARRAGYNGRSNTIGPRLLADVGIAAAIKERIAERAMSADEVLDRLAQVARNDMGDFVDMETRNGQLDLRRAKAAGKSHLIKKMTWTDNTTSIELHDSLKALELLARGHGLFVDKTALTTPDGKHEFTGLPDDERLARLAALYERVRARAMGEPDNDAAPGDGDLPGVAESGHA